MLALQGRDGPSSSPLKIDEWLWLVNGDWNEEETGDSVGTGHHIQMEGPGGRASLEKRCCPSTRVLKSLRAAEASCN